MIGADSGHAEGFEVHPGRADALCARRGWTYMQFGRAYEQAAREVSVATGDPSIASVTVAEQTFRRWTSGRIRTLPNSPAPAILHHLFKRPATELLAPPPEEIPPLPSAPAIDEMEIRMTARDAADHAGEAAAQALPDLTIDQIEDDVRGLARRYPSTSPLDSYQRGRELLRLAQAMLDRTQRPRQRERLYLQAGATAALMASASFDLGSLSPAVQLARTAALYGEVIDHGPLQAYAHGALAYLAYWDGRPTDAVRLVATAQQFGGLGDTAGVRLATIAARAHAHLGNADAARRAIRAAGECDSGVRDDLHDDVGGEFGMPLARAAMSAATTYLLLCDAPGAEETASHVLDLMDAQPSQEQPGLRGKAAVDLARARVLRGELDGALAAVEPVFTLNGSWRTLGLVQRMVGLRADLTSGGLAGATAARELGQRVEDFTAGAGARSLGPGSPLAALGG
ncbi:hypothetical protein [Streptomyces litchfieldiae]|uniref:Transcriptional regulator n=1 Tax=Streptomyces litchfieldiae TaxID=3075543 RepID=A0ABU2MW39_9ACTN|nr:hypothetical protein [Streptomyces sp. DSM 44938]MDT0345851.1 hypothetical protein [Streptomyces sp. DSM 44938]